MYVVFLVEYSVPSWDGIGHSDTGVLSRADSVACMFPYLFLG
jgi:hypothetical protein